MFKLHDKIQTRYGDTERDINIWNEDILKSWTVNVREGCQEEVKINGRWINLYEYIKTE